MITEQFSFYNSAVQNHLFHEPEAIPTQGMSSLSLSTDEPDEYLPKVEDALLFPSCTLQQCGFGVALMSLLARAQKELLLLKLPAASGVDIIPKLLMSAGSYLLNSIPQFLIKGKTHCLVQPRRMD
jgi:hypothetical protein